jgi:hypothetical protein
LEVLFDLSDSLVEIGFVLKGTPEVLEFFGKSLEGKAEFLLGIGSDGEVEFVGED